MHKTVTISPVTVTTAGTRKQIFATSLAVKSVIIQADNLNTGKVYIGDSTVSSSNGVELAARESLTITPADAGGTKKMIPFDVLRTALLVSVVCNLILMLARK